MSVKVFPKGLENFANKGTDWDTDTIRCALLRVVADTSLKVITGATNANPAVLTSAGHGLSVDHIVCIGQIGGNASCNGLFKVNTVPDANTFTLKTLADGLVVQGSGAYTSGGFLLNMSTATNRADIDAGQVVGSDGAKQLISPTLVNGELDADDVTFTAVPTQPGNADVVGAFIYRDSGAAATDRLLVWVDGRIQLVVAANAALGATTLWVDKLPGAIASGTVLAFSNGVLATLSAAANVGDRSLTVTALSAAINAGHQADAPTTGNNLPAPPNGGNFGLQFGAFIAKI